MKRVWLGVVASLLLGGGIWAQKPPLLPEKDVRALTNELSGETAKRNLEGLARFHRQRGSEGFHAAAEFVAERLRAYGLSELVILQFPADGRIFYGTQRSRPAWDAEVGDLWEVAGAEETKPGSAAALGMRPASNASVKKIASYEAEPVVLAEDSESADVTADLVDVGEGTRPSDYEAKDVKGKIALVSAQPGTVQDLAVGKFGAVGIVSYAQNQKTAWWGEDENLIRWGHLETFSPNKTFGFMVSLKTARGLRERLAHGETIRLHAVVKAGQHPGAYEVVTATIPGADAKLKDDEIAFSCHLDHQRPGANDNASGCVTILEVARTLQELIGEGKLERPARTIRFIFPPEIEGTMALLNAEAPQVVLDVGERGRATGEQPHMQRETQPAAAAPTSSNLAKRIKAVVHMDMVGGGPETKAVFHVTRGPMSLPSFVHDVAWAFAEWVNEESYTFAATGKADYPLVAPEGGKEPLRAEYSAYTMGSDHDVYQDSSFGIPAIYLNDWPDRYIHTNFDSATNIDPTKLKRAAFIGAASGYFLARMRSPQDFSKLSEVVIQGQLVRSAETFERRLLFTRAEGVDGYADSVLSHWASEYENEMTNPGLAPEWFPQFIPDHWLPAPQFPLPVLSAKQVTPSPEMKIFFRRIKQPKGPLAVFGYDYFEDHAKAAGVATPKLLSYEGLWGSGEEYAYEVLNFADGKRNALEIRDALSAEYGPVPLGLVVEYLKALEKIGLVEEAK